MLLSREDARNCNWSCCECKFCGIRGEGCKVRCHEICRITVAEERSAGGEEGFPAEIEEEHPKFCENCLEHGVLDLHLKAAQRGEKRRADAQEDSASSAAKRSRVYKEA